MKNDSGVDIDQEFIDTFLEESFEVLENLKNFTYSFRTPEDKNLFEQYGQQVDRIMGAAFTLAMKEIGELAKIGKELGYKGSQIDDISKLISIQSHLSQLNKAFQDIFTLIKNRKSPDYSQYELLLRRLKAASESLGNYRASVGIG